MGILFQEAVYVTLSYYVSVIENIHLIKQCVQMHLVTQEIINMIVNYILLHY